MSAVKERIEEGQMLSGETFALLASALGSTDAIRSLYQIGIAAYFNSSGYDTANKLFQEVIWPYLQSYDRDDFKGFLAQFEECNNSQVLDRRRARADHKALREEVNARFPDLDLAPYPKYLEAS